jgi:hydroxyacylglutathione hydrolase
MIHEILTVGALQCNCSIFGDETTHEGIVIDPGDGGDVARVLAVLQKWGLKLKAIVITHAHIDHIGGAAKLKAATGAPVYMNAADQKLYDALDVQAGWFGMHTPDSTEIDVDARDGGTLLCGATELQFIHTPGHSQGSMCVLIPSENKLIAGDTLFRESIGRTDLPGGDGRAILRSIHAKLLPLDEAVEVFPGHGPETTIGHEKARNPFLS